MSLALAILVWGWVVIILVGAPSLYLARKYDKVKAIRAKNKAWELECQRLDYQAGVEHDSVLEGNLLYGLYGNFPPAKEFIPADIHPEPEPLDVAMAAWMSVPGPTIDVPTTYDERAQAIIPRPKWYLETLGHKDPVEVIYE